VGLADRRQESPYFRTRRAVKLLGHADIRTTMIDRHVVARQGFTIESSADQLKPPENAVDARVENDEPDDDD
jgi:hypothetical protein